MLLFSLSCEPIIENDFNIDCKILSKAVWYLFKSLSKVKSLLTIAIAELIGLCTNNVIKSGIASSILWYIILAKIDIISF